MGKKVWVVAIFLSLFVETTAAANGQAEKNLHILQTTQKCIDCDLSGLDLTRMDLSRTDLRGANLSFTICNLTSFAYADLRGARLHGATLNGADMEGADLRGVDFRGVSMESVFLGDALVDDRLAGGLSPVGIPPVQVAAFFSHISQQPRPASTQAANSVTDVALPFISAVGKKRIVNIVAIAAATKVRKKKASVPSRVPANKLAVNGADFLREPIVITAYKRKRRLEIDGEVATIYALHRKRMFIVPSQQAGKAGDNTAPDSSFMAAEKRSVLQKSLQSPSKPLTPGTVAKPILSQSDKWQTTKQPPRPLQKMTVGSSVVRAEKNQSLDGFVLTAEVSSDQAKNQKLVQLLNTKKCYGCDLAGLDLSGQSLVGADLENANLTGCNLQRCDLRRANLKGAKFVQAKMQQVKIDGADCYKANFSFANLTGASTFGADFDYARLKGVVGLKRE